jgi:hypothetical protein
MFLTLRRLWGGFSLLALFLGILSTDIDSLQEHSSVGDRAAALHSENEAGLAV